MIKVLILFLLVSSSLLASESNACLEVIGIVNSEDSHLPNATITLYNNGMLNEVKSSNERGKFIFVLETNSKYEMLISKEGFYSEKIVFETKGLNAEEGELKYKFSVDLFAKIEGLNAQVFENAITLISYNVFSDAMEKYIADTTLNLINDFVSKYEVARIAAHSKIISNADSAFLNKNYELAAILYTKALNIDTYDYNSDYQLEMIERIVAQDIRIDRKYENIILEADLHYELKEYKKAKKDYQKALKYKDEVYPKHQISIIENGISLRDIYAVK